MLKAEMFGADAAGRCPMENVLKVLEKAIASDEPTMISLDDIKDIFEGESEAYILSGEAEGEKAIADAIDAAIVSPSATKILSKARSILLNIDAGGDILSMMAVSDAATTIAESSHPDAEILWNVTVDEELGDRVKALLIVSRFGEPTPNVEEPIEEFVADGEESALKVIHTDRAPAAVGPYSQAIEVNGLVFCSGQIAIDPTVGKIVETDIAGQAEQCCRNVEAVLAEAGVEIKNVVKTTCFLAEIADFKAFNEVYARHFVGKPARSCVAVKDLPAGALCEIEVIAVK
ncbi:MAG: hypothetical protein IJU71_10790 [Selenomonadaceae bacterium]|nr:hypothetical protein [Selenomonadaceae bacterium]